MLHVCCTPLSAREGLARASPCPTGSGRSIDATTDETILPGTFARSLRVARSLPLLAAHDGHRFPVGVAVGWDERRDGLHGRWRMARTREADAVWGLVTDEVLTGLSIGFQPEVSDWKTSGRVAHVLRRQARLLEVSVVACPAYPTAVVTGWDDAVPEPSTATPRADAVRAWLRDVA